MLAVLMKLKTTGILGTNSGHFSKKEHLAFYCVEDLLYQASDDS